MQRKDFIKLTSGIISGLGIHQILGNESLAQKKVGEHSLDDSYLTKGLTGMAKAEGWFNAHWGAGILAGYYLCKDNPLSQETVAGIKQQLDAAVKVQASQFVPLPTEASNERLIHNIPHTLRPAMKDGVRAHGHAVIFASLSTRALRDAPQMAQPSLIDAICTHNHAITRIKPKKAPEVAPYSNSQDMVEALFDKLASFKGLLGRPSIKRPNFTHMTTHTEALLNLELMGYGDLAKSGYLGHQAHLDEIPPHIDASSPRIDNPATLEKIMNQAYWQDPKNIEQWNQKWNTSDHRNGYWIAAGHLFKVLYSYHRLIKKIQDPEKVRLCSEILLERYFNPEVNGG